MTIINHLATTIIAGLVLTVAGAYYYQKQQKKRKDEDIVPSTWEEVGKITHLNLYPLKSGHRLELQRAQCTEFGLKQTKEDENSLQMRDRMLVVYSEKDHEFRSGRTYPKMTLIDVSVHDEIHLAVDAPTMRTLYVRIPTKNDENQTKIKLHKGEEIPTIDCGDEPALWLSRYLLGKDKGLRLGYHDGSSRRDITRTHKIALDFYKDLSNSSTGLYADLASTNLINQASINDLSNKLNNCTISVNNFRPNFVVDGLYLKPFEEHEWYWVKIGDVILKNVKDCTRCIFTTVDPESGLRNANREPFKTLGEYRLSDGPDNLPVMGINLEPQFLEETLPNLLSNLADDEKIGAVVFDYDINLTILKLQKCLTYLKRKDCLFVIGAGEKYTPFGDVGPLVGNHYFYMCLKEISGREPIQIAKPSVLFNDMLIEKFKIESPGRILFIGDSIEEDMGFAVTAGYKKLLVLTGTTDKEHLFDWKYEEKMKPQYYVKSLSVLNEIIKSCKVE